MRHQDIKTPGAYEVALDRSGRGGRRIRQREIVYVVRAIAIILAVSALLAPASASARHEAISQRLVAGERAQVVPRHHHRGSADWTVRINGSTVVFAEHAGRTVWVYRRGVVIRVRPHWRISMTNLADRPCKVVIRIR